MESRRSYWYSIIKYIADFTKGEMINIGIFVENEEIGTIKYLLLEPENKKFTSAFENKLQKDVYRYGKDYFDYLMVQINQKKYPLVNTSGSLLIQHLAKGNELPKGFILSEPQYAKTSNVDQLMINLETTYIGAKFLDKESSSKELVVKEKAIQMFDEAQLINKKIKHNVKISPSPILPFKYQIDFAYRVKDNIELIQSAPGNIDLLPSWFEKINVFSSNYKQTGKISLLYDSSVEGKLFSDTKSVIKLLTESDKKIEAIDINNKSNGMCGLIRSINKDAMSVKSLEKLIAM